MTDKIQLNERDTYQTRDGSRRGIRVRRLDVGQFHKLGGLWYEGATPTGTWYGNGSFGGIGDNSGDLIPETPHPASILLRRLSEGWRRAAASR